MLPASAAWGETGLAAPLHCRQKPHLDFHTNSSMACMGVINLCRAKQAWGAQEWGWGGVKPVACEGMSTEAALDVPYLG